MSVRAKEEGRIEPVSWTGIREELLRRIHCRVWQPGEQIPHEADLAEEFGCARTTVNRALRDLAESGLVVRKRRAGTRVVLNPPQRATLTIPVIREEVEALGQSYKHRLLHRELGNLPPMLHAAFPVPDGTDVLYLKSIHFADDRPYGFEERYINPAAAAGALEIDFQAISANEWLVHNAPFTSGDLSFYAVNAAPDVAQIMGTEPGAALFSIERVTRNDSGPITFVRLIYGPGYRMRTAL